jgi:Carboxypeptidase regulatory-like domain/TonB dependent receptor-like, beta-barrel
MAGIASLVLGLAICLGLAARPAAAQTAGEAAIQGTVTDPAGAVIPGATVTATDDSTGVATTRTTTSNGFYVISPLPPGTYTVTAGAQGFSDFKQLNVTVAAMQNLGLNISLKVGAANQNVTVTAAPPELDTTSATLGSSISSSVYLDLPILTNNQQRDITAFSNLLPGAQPGARSSLFSGTQSRVEEVYLDGIPITTISQIGDNRPVFNVVPSEAIGQINVVTSSASAEYQGAGMVNYTTKSGGNAYHGTVADFVRNTAFDTWGFTAITATRQELVNGVITKVPAGQPADHQNEFTFSVGGPISIPHLFSGRDKLFFFGSYDKYHARSAANPSQTTIPTTKMRTGDFSELLSSNGGPGYVIYDPTTQGQCTANSTTGPCRYAFGQTYGGTPGPAGNPSGTPTNIIPAGEISPIAKYMEQWLPDPTLSGPGIISNNYLGGSPTGYDNWLYAGRIDYDVSDKQRIAWVITGGNRVAWPFTSTANLQLPIPYTQSDYSTVAGHWSDLEDTYTVTPHLVNQFRFGWSNFGGPPLKNLTEGIKQYEATTAGIGFTGVPADGQAVTEFPTNAFSGSNAPEQWGDGGSGQTSTTVTESYTTIDNLLWVKGNHSMTFGFQMQRLEDNTSSYDGPASSLTLNWSPNETACIVPGGKGSTCAGPVAGSGYSYLTNTGFSYASYMLGAVDSTGISLQPFSVLGGRYQTYAPYFQDDWKATSKLTLNLGLRWDYIGPYHEVLNRFSYLNPTLTNPVTGTPGTLQFAGSWGGSGVGCNCSTPVHSYWKNWGPHVGFAYELTNKTVIRGGFATLYSHGGGTGGASGAGTGPSQLGFTSSVSWAANAAGPGAGPVFYLNNSSGYQALGLGNANLGGPGYSVPAIQAPGAVSQTLNVGNTVDSSGNYIKASGAPTFADFYVSGRAPEFNFWNFGIDREISNNISISIDYAGSESHFLYGASNMRGLYAGQVNPIYYPLGGLLNSAATPANVAKAQAIIPSITVPYAGFEAAASTSGGAGQATIGRMLTWMPQFSGTSDIWGDSTANASYHALQISAHKRMSNGLDITANYTYSKQIDDAGTQRDGYAIPASLTLNGKGWAQNRIDRSISATSVPQNLAVFGTYHMPFGAGSFGGSANPVVKQVIKGWELGGTFTYSSGTPLLVTSSNCTDPFAGTCMPDVNPKYTSKTIRENGSWGKGITAANFSAIHYLVNSQDGSCTAGACPFSDPQAYMFGDAARVLAYDGLRNPGSYSLNGSVSRTFDITERWKFVFRADCQNIPNKVTFGGIQASMDSTAFGEVSSATGNTGSRDFQFSGRINF